jgi:hypothetical protein
VDTACWTWTGDRRHGWRRIVENGDDARPLDTGWTLRWADASGRATNHDSSAARTTRGITLYGRGLTTATTGSCSGGPFAGQAAPRRTAVLRRIGRRVGRKGDDQVLWRWSSLVNETLAMRVRRCGMLALGLGERLGGLTGFVDDKASGPEGVFCSLGWPSTPACRILCVRSAITGHAP